MPDAKYFCPNCGSIDLAMEEERGVVIPATHRKVECPNCAWSGTLNQTLGALSTETFWDVERVADIMLRVLAKHAVGPLVQVLEFTGLMPKPVSLEESGPGRVGEEATAERRAWLERGRRHNAIVEETRNVVLRRVCEAALTAAFEAAEERAKTYATEMGTKPNELWNEPSPN